MFCKGYSRIEPEGSIINWDMMVKKKCKNTSAQFPSEFISRLINLTVGYLVKFDKSVNCKHRRKFKNLEVLERQLTIFS